MLRQKFDVSWACAIAVLVRLARRGRADAFSHLGAAAAVTASLHAHPTEESKSIFLCSVLAAAGLLKTKVAPKHFAATEGLAAIARCAASAERCTTSFYQSRFRYEACFRLDL